ncbi:MAG: hypothetical protein ABI619_07400, partial [Betaproteobacteria bacterium]
PDDPRRRLLVKLLGAGALSYLPGSRVLADVLGEKPEKLPPDRSIYRLNGEVRVNGAPATLKTRVGGTDTVETGKGSEVVFVSGASAFILRESSRMSLGQETSNNVLTNALRLMYQVPKMLKDFPGPPRIGQRQVCLGCPGLGGSGRFRVRPPVQRPGLLPPRCGSRARGPCP